MPQENQKDYEVENRKLYYPKLLISETIISRLFRSAETAPELSIARVQLHRRFLDPKPTWRRTSWNW